MRAYKRLRVRLKKTDRDKLDDVLSGGLQPVRTVLRALALSHLHDEKPVSEVAAIVRLTPKAVREIGRRYLDYGLEQALYDKARPGAAPVLEDRQRRHIIAMVCSDPPEGCARWTIRLVAEEAVKRRLVPRIGRESIRLLLLHDDLKPWREKNVVRPRTLTEDYLAKMEDVLETYERPYSPQEPVLCLDEKPITLHADVRPASPAEPGREARHDSEYKRCGTANVFCAVEPQAGRHYTFPTPNRSGFEFALVIADLALQYPKAETIHLVMDNLNIHRRKSLATAFGAEIGGEIWNRFTVHYTPTHGSWLNQAEIEIGMFSRQCLGAKRIPDLKTLRRQARA